MTNANRALAALGLLLTGCSGGGGQSVECSRYLACVAKLSGSSASLDSTYGANGSCWVDTRMAETCTTKCKTALAAFPSDAGC